MTLSNVNNAPLPVFDETVMDFLGAVSAEILGSSVGRTHPDLTAFAFYVRRANLQKLKARFGETDGRLGRGLCFHVAPANIPVNFAFSWAFSLLAGNANVVRMPSKEFPQVEALLEILHRTMSAYPAVAERNVFVRYPRTDLETTSAYSAMADCRMIWGGDRTIAAIRALPTRPRCVDIAFADRYSVGMIDGLAVLAADEARISRLAQDFYNDTYLMDQNACSSPQLILWENDDPLARKRFWTAVCSVAERKYRLQEAVSVDKYADFCREMIDNPYVSGVLRQGNLLYRIELSRLGVDLPSRRGKAGMFFEYALAKRHELLDVITEKYQTITQFGVDADSLREQIVAAGLRGVDRIVPFGRAMDIDVVWDGYDIVRTLSRTVTAD